MAVQRRHSPSIRFLLMPCLVVLGVLNAGLNEAHAQTSDPAAGDAAFEAAFVEKFSTGTKPVLEAVGKDAMIAFFENDGFDVYVEQETENEIVLREEDQNDSGFYAVLLDCNAGQCSEIEFLAYFDPSGVTLSSINKAHEEIVVGSTIMLEPEIGIVAKRVRLVGGVTFANFEDQVVLFLSDINAFFQGLSPSDISSVNFAVTNVSGVAKVTTRPKIAAFSGSQAQRAFRGPNYIDDPVVNEIGANAPDFTPNR
ncbi:MAG: hypothetical protein AAGA22_09570 [Pseudomonadota bacterium]